MKASAYMSAGSWSKSIDVEIDSSSESDLKFARQVLSSLVEIKEPPKTVRLTIDGEELAKAVKEATNSALADDVS